MSAHKEKTVSEWIPFECKVITPTQKLIITAELPSYTLQKDILA